MPVSFDGPSTTITLPATGTYDAEIDLYSDWKEWVVQGDNAKYLPAFDATGGDDIGGGQEIAPYFFLRTDYGWSIKAPEQDGDLIIQGNLFPRVSGQSLFSPPDGDFTVLITQSLSAKAVVVNTGGSGLTAEESAKLNGLPSASENATAVWDEVL